jgi:TM2 domain-containing membrane protein YozV
MPLNNETDIVYTAVPTGAPKSRTIAVLLALFFGGIGLHRFYLGKARSGIIYLLFCWTFIPALVAFFEAIRWLCMSNQGFADRYRAAA